MNNAGRFNFFTNFLYSDQSTVYTNQVNNYRYGMKISSGFSSLPFCAFGLFLLTIFSFFECRPRNICSDRTWEMYIIHKFCLEQGPTHSILKKKLCLREELLPDMESWCWPYFQITVVMTPNDLPRIISLYWFFRQYISHKYFCL